MKQRLMRVGVGVALAAALLAGFVIWLLLTNPVRLLQAAGRGFQ